MFFSKKIKNKELIEFENRFKKITNKNRFFCDPQFKNFDEEFQNQQREFEKLKKEIKTNLDTKL